jgi:tetratricopeptide (TPR) repeat protein
MNPNEFIAYLKFPGKLNDASLIELQSLLIEYPNCSSIRILLAKNLFILKSDKKEDFLKTSSIYFYDRKKIFRIIHDITEDNNIQPIPAYSIENFEKQLNADDEPGQETDTDIKDSNDLIDKFLKDQPKLNLKPAEHNFEEEEIHEESGNDQEFVSEILAEIYWKQGNRDKAISIYKKLSLNFPEKSSYFATQIEKVKKEII